ncbi:class I SAM-dependent methyltransferase [Streptomyces sp. HF10]|uniref:class I SAM-dependent methyltransferase n=1 Tax=Streptomyces sp. HF10 TaxID=2692233 RepID=UPI0013194419|nr:class I SAM-dependent methyltransferase [Streptomyces sp. HF10]QHC28705.1 class I SAM-dependent methyltransferase [Streptomyces sp. HF10]
MGETIRLAGVHETLLATLQARAIDNRQVQPVLGDATAEDLLRRIDYDFSRIKTATKDVRIVTYRARKLDEWAAEFLAARPGALVLHLACGLDSRAFRLEMPPGVEWIDVDVPDVIELRKRLYPHRDRYRMIGASVTTEEWLDSVTDDRPALVIAEGLTPYLREADGEAMLRRLTRHLPSGAVMFDAVLPWTLRFAKYSQLLRATGATFGWGIGDPRILECRIPGLRFGEQWSLLDSPHLAGARPAEKAVGAVMRSVPQLRYAHRLLRYDF